MAFGQLGDLVAKYNSSLPTITDGDYVVLQTDVNGRLLVKVDAALPTGSNTIGAISNLFALDATLAKLTIAPGTALGANTLAMVGGSVTTAAPSYTNGQISPLSLDTSGSLRVTVAGGTTAPSKADDGAFTVGTDLVSPLGALADETTPDSVDEGDVGVVRMSLNRNLYIQMRDGQGNERSAYVTAANALKVDGSAVTQPVSGTITANAGTGTFTTQDTSSLVDNAGFTDGTSRVLPAGYYFDDTAGTALTENDIAAARIDSKRAQMFVLEDATTRGRKATVSVGGALLVDASATTQPVSGTVAVSSITTSVTPGTAAGNLGKAEDAIHNTGDTGVFALAVRADTAAATGANGDYVGLLTDSTGRLWVNASGAGSASSEAGTEGDVSSDSGGAGDGTVPITGSLTLVAEKPHTSGTAYITGFDFCCDEPASCDLIVMDGDVTLVETIRVGIVTPSSPSISYTFPRAIEVTGAATRDIKLRARTLNGNNAEAGGGINLYTR